MTRRSGPLAIGISAALAAVTLHGADARACGGCFHPEDQPETTVVTAHRMALSISTTQTVLWDQVQYAGSPEEFAWVLPVKAGARIELSTDAWFEALDAATSTRVVGPALNCGFGGGFEDGSGSGCGCSSTQSDAAGAAEAPRDGIDAAPPVTVVHQEAVGPYETVTLRTEVPGALTAWLTTHGFAIDAEIQPIIDAYTRGGFDFIALRLLPNQGVQQMKPVRIVTEGAAPTLPLRMVAAGTGANVDITLFVIGEGRWQTANFPIGIVDQANLTWDFNTSSSTYGTVRQGLFAQSEGRTWLNAYAKQGALLSTVMNPLTGGPVVFQPNGAALTTIAALYVAQGLANGETSSTACTAAFTDHADSASLVVNPCTPAAGGGTGDGGAGGSGGAGGTGGSGGAGGGESCGVVARGEIDARTLACDTLDDLAVALTGTHPRDVWLTRLEAKLPRAALKDDLTLAAAPAQTPVENWLQAGKATNEPCPVARAAAAFGGPGDDAPRGPGSRTRTRAALLAAGVTAVVAALLRRAGTRRVAGAPA